MSFSLLPPPSSPDEPSPTGQFVLPPEPTEWTPEFLVLRKVLMAMIPGTSNLNQVWFYSVTCTWWKDDPQYWEQGLRYVLTPEDEARAVEWIRSRARAILAAGAPDMADPRGYAAFDAAGVRHQEAQDLLGEPPSESGHTVLVLEVLNCVEAARVGADVNSWLPLVLRQRGGVASPS